MSSVLLGASNADQLMENIGVIQVRPRVCVCVCVRVYVCVHVSVLWPCSRPCVCRCGGKKVLLVSIHFFMTGGSFLMVLVRMFVHPNPELCGIRQRSRTHIKP